MTTNENVLVKKVLKNLAKHRKELSTYQGEDRWSSYKEATLNDQYSMKLNYSDNGEIQNIALTTDCNLNFQSLNVTRDSKFYDDCLNIARYLFGETMMQKSLYI